MWVTHNHQMPKVRDVAGRTWYDNGTDDGKQVRTPECGCAICNKAFRGKGMLEKLNLRVSDGWTMCKPIEFFLWQSEPADLRVID